MLNRVVVALACGALACALGLGWYTATVRAENKRLSATVTGLTVEVATQRKLVTASAAAARKSTAAKVLLEEQHRKDTDALAAALVREPDWAGAAVPPDVSRALGVQLPTPAP